MSEETDSRRKYKTFASLREQKGFEIARDSNAIRYLDSGQFAVRSQTGHGEYIVNINNEGDATKCTCQDYESGAKQCKHMAAIMFRVWKSSDLLQMPPPLPRKTYTQDWHSYNAAQFAERKLFPIFLHDLLNAVEEPVQAFGRPWIPLREALFCAIIKVGAKATCRQSRGEYERFAEEGLLSAKRGYVISSKVLNREDITPILHELITTSAMPLSSLETQFAVDSSGFRTTRFNSYAREKYGLGRCHVWLKAHAVTGVKTHTIVKVRITEANGPDSPQFIPLVRGVVSAGFTIEDVYADMAYCSRKHFDLADRLTFEFHVPFPSNSTGKSKGCLAYSRAFHYFQSKRKEFEEEYHLRSNVESVFSAIKMKSGETLVSHKKVAQMNELLAKIIYYNITVLIHEMYEHGIIPTFLQDDHPEILKEISYTNML